MQQDISNPFLLNALILGPFMLYAAMKGSLGFQDRLMLGATGAVMVWYNLDRYRTALQASAEDFGAQQTPPTNAEVVGVRG